MRNLCITYLGTYHLGCPALLRDPTANKNPPRETALGVSGSMVVLPPQSNKQIGLIWSNIKRHNIGSPTTRDPSWHPKKATNPRHLDYHDGGHLHPPRHLAVEYPMGSGPTAGCNSQGNFGQVIHSNTCNITLNHPRSAHHGRREAVTRHDTWVASHNNRAITAHTCHLGSPMQYDGAG